MWNVNSIIKAGELLLPELATKFGSRKNVYRNTGRKEIHRWRTFLHALTYPSTLGIMEKADNVYVSLGDFGWSDLGTWGSLYDLSQKGRIEIMSL